MYYSTRDQNKTFSSLSSLIEETNNEVGKDYGFRVASNRSSVLCGLCEKTASYQIYQEVVKRDLLASDAIGKLRCMNIITKLIPV